MNYFIFQGFFIINIIFKMKELNAVITGVSAYVPNDILTNNDIAKLVDTSDEWITTRVGIKERRILKGEGKVVFKYAVSSMADISEEILQKNNLAVEDVKWFIPHQANKRIIDAAQSRLGIPDDKVMLNIDKYGNTSAGTIPLCLWDWEDKLKKGDNIILAAFGAGFSWGAVYLKWGYDGE